MAAISQKEPISSPLMETAPLHQQQIIIYDPQLVDHFYFSTFFDPDENHKLYPIFDSTYAQELQFQESLMSSLQTAVLVPTTTAEDTGQSSTSFCQICADKKDPQDMLVLKSCSHSFCSHCVSSHVAARLYSHDVPAPPLTAPPHQPRFRRCRARPTAPRGGQVDKMLCLLLKPASEKFYCPFKDCSAMMVMDMEGDVFRESECPVCHRFYARCYVGWREGIGCEEFEKLNEYERGREDLMVREMAKSQS